MGALIVTKGTRRLAHYFNRLFSDFTPFAPGHPYEQIVTDLGPNSTIVPSPSYPFLYQLSEAYRGQRIGGGDVFYPDYNTHHANLLPRWKYFLRFELDPTWHNAIRDALYDGLTAGTYSKIAFDSVVGSAQLVMVADEYGFSADGNEDNRTGTKYLKIVLVTPATQAPYPLDDQTPH